MTAHPERNVAEDLRRYFAYRLPARVSEIEAARDAARGAGWRDDPLRTFHRLAHSLAGAGSTFGFPEVSAVSHRLESLLKSALGSGAPLDETEVEDLLTRLRDLAERPLEPAAGAPPERGSAAAGEEGLLYLWSDDSAFRESFLLQLRPFGYEVQAF